MKKEKRKQIKVDLISIPLVPKKIARNFSIDEEVLDEFKKYKKRTKERINFSFIINEYLWSLIRYLKTKEESKK